VNTLRLDDGQERGLRKEKAIVRKRSAGVVREGRGNMRKRS
jgi:hypothetical protein